MTPTARSDGVAACICSACPLLCDDVVVAADGVDRACAQGRTALQAALADAEAPGPQAWHDGKPLNVEEGIVRAARVLHTARRLLVAGLHGATLEEIAAACDLAETAGAALDAGLAESARPAGPTIARAGAVTAAWEELRDRADLVVFWGCDPAASHPRFVERFVVPPLAGGAPRHTISFAATPVVTGAAGHLHLPPPDGRAAHAGGPGMEAARHLELLLTGIAPPVTADDDAIGKACQVIHAAIRAARCVAIVTDEAADAVGLASWSMARLVRAIAHEKPAFEVPLGAGIAAGGANGSGAAAVCTWRYGAAGAIARADRAGGTFLPGEFDGVRLVRRGEVDAVLAVGRLPRGLEEAVADRGPALAVVRIDDATADEGIGRERGVRLRCASHLLAGAGTMLRGDGRPMTLVPLRPATAPPMERLLRSLESAIRNGWPAPGGGR